MWQVLSKIPHPCEIVIQLDLWKNKTETETCKRGSEVSDGTEDQNLPGF